MIIIIGGAFQGKKQYAERVTGIPGDQMTDGADCSLEEIYSCQCLYHFHEWVRRKLPDIKDYEQEARKIFEANPELLLIANELGCGVVPANAFDRNFRETEGRLLTCLAGMSSEVHRVVCGIGTVIKG